jgi:hypothetical protein
MKSDALPRAKSARRVVPSFRCGLIEMVVKECYPVEWLLGDELADGSTSPKLSQFEESGHA